MNRHSRQRHALSLLALVMAHPVQADSGPLQFDLNILKERGLDPSLSQYFADAAKFMPGRHTVHLYVNGNNRGQVSALFGPDGGLCVDRPFLNAAGLVVTDGAPAHAEAGPSATPAAHAACYDYRRDVPRAIINALPGGNELDLIVPQDAVVPEGDSSVIHNVDTGGSAGILNYSLMSTSSLSDGERSDYNQADLENGFNMGDWLLRSHHILTDSNGEFSVNALNTYVQHTFAGRGQTLQAGQVNMTSPLFSTGTILGAQLTPEDSLKSAEASGASVAGIARTAQARVEIRQAGQLIYATLVPAGAFTLDNVPVTRSNTDLDVTVKETDGSTSHFVIPAAALQQASVGQPEGFSVAVGRWDDDSDTGEKPWVATASDGWRPRHWMNITAAAIVANQYDAVGAQVSIKPLERLQLSTTVKGADDRRHGHQGASIGAAANLNLPAGFSTSLSATYYTAGYRELTDTLQDNFTRSAAEYSAALSWQNTMLGAFSASYSLSDGADGTDTSRYLNLSWGKSIGHVSISVNWQHQLSKSHDSHTDTGHHYDSSTPRTDDDDRVYVNISVPLGGQTVSSYLQQQGDDESAGLRTSGEFGHDNSYSLSAGRSFSDDEYTFDGSLNSNLRYTQLGLNAGTSSADNRNYGLTLSGGMALHKGALLFSPYAIQDTFGVASLGEKLSGVGFETPAGEVWTDHWGRALLPSLTPYHNNRVELDANTLPDDASLDNGFGSLATGRGAVGDLSFGMTTVHRAMITVHLADGSLLPKGASVVDKDGNYAGTVVDDGVLFLENADARPQLFLKNSDGRRVCQIRYTLSSHQDGKPAAYYEQVNGLCQ